MAEIAIKDSGIGIDSEHHKVIFEKLYQMGEVQLHSSSRTNYKGGGAGLGLAIASGIVRALQGMIWVESPGRDEEKFPGSQFHVMLPLGVFAGATNPIQLLTSKPGNPLSAIVGTSGSSARASASRICGRRPAARACPLTAASRGQPSCQTTVAADLADQSRGFGPWPVEF